MIKKSLKDPITTIIGLIVIFIGTLGGFGVEPFASNQAQLTEHIQQVPQLYEQGETIVTEAIDFGKILWSWAMGFGLIFAKDGKRESLTAAEKAAIKEKMWNKPKNIT